MASTVIIITLLVALFFMMILFILARHYAYNAPEERRTIPSKMSLWKDDATRAIEHQSRIQYAIKVDRSKNPEKYQ